MLSPCTIVRNQDKSNAFSVCSCEFTFLSLLWSLLKWSNILCLHGAKFFTLLSCKEVLLRRKSVNTQGELAQPEDFTLFERDTIEYRDGQALEVFRKPFVSWTKTKDMYGHEAGLSFCMGVIAKEWCFNETWQHVSLLVPPQNLYSPAYHLTTTETVNYKMHKRVQKHLRSDKFRAWRACRAYKASTKKLPQSWKSCSVGTELKGYVVHK